MSKLICKIAETFLRKHAMDVDSIDPEATIQAFLTEMESGLSPAGSSLAMIPTFITCDSDVPKEKPVIVIDAGGTNLRICTVTFHEKGEPTIDNFTKFRMPGVSHEISKEAFFDIIFEYLVPVLDLSDQIGFCFSYPSEILPNRDGRLLYWTKEIQIPELVGELIGESLNEALVKRGHRPKNIVILNDTVAALLAGKTVGEGHQCSGYAGFILGTGTNTAYVEKNRNIIKRDALGSNGSQIINIESGAFDKCHRGAVDHLLDASTANPGSYVFEKMISGVYLGRLCLELIKIAAEENLFGPGAKQLVGSWTELSTKDMDDFLWNPYREDSPFHSDDIAEEDRELMFYLFGEIVSRAALLAAINISSSVIKSNAGKSPLHPLCINIDGSTFHKTYNFPRQAFGHLDQILKPRGIYYLPVEVDNAPILGAAIAGLSQVTF